LWIEGDWTSETLEPDDLAGVKGLKVAATDYSFAFIDKFVDLLDIEILTRPKRKQVIIPRIAGQLNSASTVWIDEWTPALLRSVSLRSVSLEGVPFDAALNFRNESRLEEIKIIRSKIKNLDAFSDIESVRRLDVVLCPRLLSVRKNSFLALEQLRIENSKLLSDISFISSLRFLRELRLNYISPGADLEPCYRCETLRFLMVVGAEKPILDWARILRLPKIEKISGWWDPSVLRESDFCKIVESVGRRLIRFEPGGRKAGASFVSATLQQ
jgi:hypothetical protein